MELRIVCQADGQASRMLGILPEGAQRRVPGRLPSAWGDATRPRLAEACGGGQRV